MGLQIEKKVFEPIPGSKWVAFLGKTLDSRSASLSTQVHSNKWVPVNLMLGGNPAMD